jgi:hypothetical protein
LDGVRRSLMVWTPRRARATATLKATEEGGEAADALGEGEQRDEGDMVRGRRWRRTGSRGGALFWRRGRRGRGPGAGGAGRGGLGA